MGWLFSYGQTRSELIERLTREQENFITVGKACVGNTLYAIHELKQAIGTNPAGFRFAAVYLLAPGRKGDLAEGWGYKDMDEGMGPVEASCPLTLLDLLDGHEPTNENARDWRERCRAHHERKRKALARGKELKGQLVPGVRFTLYGKLYTVQGWRARSLLAVGVPPETVGLYRIKPTQIAHVQIVPTEEAPAPAAE